VGLRHCTDVSAADWVANSRVPWGQLVKFGPAGFPAYARLRFIPDPVREGQDEADVDVGPDWPSERELLGEALQVLRQHTGTADECYFCVWDGWGAEWITAVAALGQPPPGVQLPMVDIGFDDPPRSKNPDRSYFLLRGGVSDFLDPDGAWAEIPEPVEPAFVWPADHAWCVAFDVDPHYAGIGASTAAIDELVRHPGLDVVRAIPDAHQPHYN
jgi:hypothetical protein